MAREIHEECGVFGIYAKERKNVAALSYYGLFELQHRGQQSCGIAVNDSGVIKGYKDVGLVNDVFTKEKLDSLGEGKIAVGHVHYGTKITATRENAQPFVVNHMKGSMALATNGAIVNSGELRRELELGGSIFHTLSDGEIMAAIIIKERLKTGSIEEAVSNAIPRFKGAHSTIIMSPQKLIGFRDPLGFRPLSIGMLGEDYVLSSETCGLDAIGAEFVRDVEPGEIVVIDKDGLRSIKKHMCEGKKAFCVFEYIYFSRPDSLVNGTLVHDARRKAGALLALSNHVDADVVIGVPDSGLDAAMGYAQQSGIPYGLGFIKNKYIGRTFIQPDQSYRENRVRIKLNVVKSTVAGKRVVMVDDSIVRGTTSARIVNLLRAAGATEVHVRSSAPPFIHPCYFGTDIDSREKLIAYHYTIDEIAEKIGADSVGYLNIEDLVKLAPKNEEGICDACFTGNYPVEVDEEGECSVNEKLQRKL
ncbi:MAG: amidophosphoribosyltransferase [Firmicutes bacterium]|nr:amidophosphoribosyltransferase [Bacillota bacterium]